MEKSLPERIDEEISKFLFGDNYDKEPYVFAKNSNSFQQQFQKDYPEEYDKICEKCQQEKKSK